MPSKRNLPQPPSKPGRATPTHEMVRTRLLKMLPAIREADKLTGRNGAPALEQLIADLAERDAIGTAKYGVTHQADNGRDHRIDAYQKAQDLEIYLAAACHLNPSNDKLGRALSYATAALLILSEELLEPTPSTTPSNGVLQ